MNLVWLDWFLAGFPAKKEIRIIYIYPQEELEYMANE